MNLILLFSEIPPAGNVDFLLWSIALLVAAIGVIWRLYVSAMAKMDENNKKNLDEIRQIMDVRVKEKDQLIKELIERNEKIQADKEKMIGEIKPSLDASNNIARSVLDLIRNGK